MASYLWLRDSRRWLREVGGIDGAPHPAMRHSLLFGMGAVAALMIGCAATASEDETASDEINAGPSPSVKRESDGALRFDSNIPARVRDCTGGGANCADVDHDGLVDAWEDAVLDRLHPAVTFDEDEPMLKDEGKNDALVTLGRVSLRGGADGDDPNSNHVTVNVLLLYTRDYGAPNPVCFSASKHAGDVERVAIDLELDASGKSAVARAFFTTGHEGTEDDQSHIWKGGELSSLETISDPTTKLPRWRVYASQGKHATYATTKQCEGVRLKSFLHRFCVNEDCAPDRIDDKDKPRFTRVPKIANVGEPPAGAHRVDDLGALGFKNENAWSDATFCGGLAVDRTKEECPPSVKEKLLKDPFAAPASASAPSIR